MTEVNVEIVDMEAIEETSENVTVEIVTTYVVAAGDTWLTIAEAAKPSNISTYNYAIKLETTNPRLATGLTITL